MMSITLKCDKTDFDKKRQKCNDNTAGNSGIYTFEGSNFNTWGDL